MVLCPKCQKENLDNTIYCLYCGTELNRVQIDESELKAKIRRDGIGFIFMGTLFLIYGAVFSDIAGLIAGVLGGAAGLTLIWIRHHLVYALMGISLMAITILFIWQINLNFTITNTVYTGLLLFVSIDLLHTYYKYNKIIKKSVNEL